MSNGFLPISKQDMIDEALSSLILCMSAVMHMWIIRPLDMQ